MLEERGHEYGDVILAGVQGGNVDRDNVEPVEEVTAEFPLFHKVGEIPVCGGKYSAIGLERCVPPDPPEFAALYEPQYLGLDDWADVADFIEKQRPLVRDFHDPLLHRPGVGERALFMAEEFAFDERIGYGCAVQCHERFRGAVALLVDVRGDQLFPGPACPLDEDCRFGRCHLCRNFKHFLECLALTDHLKRTLQAVDRSPEDQVVDEELPALERALDRPEKFVR